MAKEKKQKKLRVGFFKEFKKFISRGNVLDMAVGIIVGGAFTAIVTAIVNGILTPLLQSIGVSEEGFGALSVALPWTEVTDATGEVIQEALRIDFGIVISAIVTFLLTALILFTIIYTVNSLRRAIDKRKEALKEKLAAKEEEATAEEPAAEAPVAEEPAPAPAPTTEELLTQIRDLLAAQNEKKE